MIKITTKMTIEERWTEIAATGVKLNAPSPPSLSELFVFARNSATTDE